MTLWRKLFDRAYRRARAAEAAGDYRRAAALYAESAFPEDAANALLFHATRVRTLDERLDAYHDALRWLPPGHPRRNEVEGRIGLAILDEAQRRGARSPEERRRLTEAAERLERAGRCSDAATAWELLGRNEDLARCLEKAGEVERLEQLLERTNAEESRERRVRRLVGDHEMAVRHGARLEARAALREAVGIAPDDTAIADMLRHLEARLPKESVVRLSIDGRPVCFVGHLPAALGRDADVCVRGASVSRRHCEIAVTEGGLVVRDLASRNGTLVRGVPIAGELSLSGEAEIGLGDDVTLRVAPSGDRACTLGVVDGLDRGLRAVIGDGALRLADLPCTISFVEGHATLAADARVSLTLVGQPVALPVVLLVGDTLVLGPHTLEVLP